MEQIASPSQPTYDVQAADRRVAEMQAAAGNVEGDVQDAQHRLQQHELHRPQLAAEVPAWARRKAELAAELEAYTAIRDEARAQARQTQQQAHHACVGALYLAWEAAVAR